MADGDDGHPLVVDLARVMRSRTKTKGAGYAGDFLNADEAQGPTNPTHDEAAALIADAASEVYGNDDIGPFADLPTTAHAKVARAIVWLAAANVELAHYSEQGNAGRSSTSPYDRYMARYEAALGEAVAAIVGDTGSGQPPAGALLPRATFPRNAGGMIGNGSEW